MPGANQAPEHIAAQENKKPHEDPNAEKTDSGDFVILSDKKEGSAGTNQKSGEQSASHAGGRIVFLTTQKRSC